ncbi:conserved hypothetical protein [Candidatus Desulfarcum epimagneticum]|uniref:GTPase n=1 Tax=uncultured Desulfobacteraceae bacterium TaxID=218296 RepID=A0A484HJX5_9BACT|nr:conserved hypothetical protein [uncultured Desulfobacteraceae bacterium]
MTPLDVSDEKERRKELDDILRRHVWASMGAGVIPAPLADIAALAAIQLAMIKRIAGLYEADYFKESVEKIASSLLGYALFGSMAPAALSALKAIPLVGQAIGAMAAPAFCGGSTYATGKALIMHFESGGTLFSFDPEKVKGHYKKMFEEGKRFARDLQHEKGTPDTDIIETKEELSKK